MRFYLLLSLALFATDPIDAQSEPPVSRGDTQTCAQAVVPCFRNSTCLARYNAYNKACTPVFYDFSGNLSCPSDCSDRFRDLLTDPHGADLHDCDCGDDILTCRLPGDNFALRCLGDEPAPKCNLSSVTALSQSFCTDYVSQCLSDLDCREAYNRFWAGNPLFDVAGTSVCDSPWAAGWCNPTCKQALYDFMCEWGQVTERASYTCAPDDELYVAHQISIGSRIEASCLDRDERTSLQFCDNAERECRNDAVCGPLFSDFEAACKELSNGETTNCSRECLAAFQALDANRIGSFFKRCTCEGDDGFCIRRGSYVSFYCFNDVLGVPQVCNDILNACTDDPICNQTGQKYLMACSPDLTEKDECSDACKKFADQLTGPVTGRLDHCYCLPSDAQCLAYQRIKSDCSKPPQTDYEAAFARWEASYKDWEEKYEQWVNEQCPNDS